MLRTLRLLRRRIRRALGHSPRRRPPEMTTELRAEPLSPLDAATLWGQMTRLNTEVVATRTSASLLLNSGIAAARLTNLPHLPRIPHSIVLSVKRGMRHRGVVILTELDGGTAWEVVSLRLAREMDHAAVTSLLAAASDEMVQRGGKRLMMRYAESSPYEDAIHAAGLQSYVSEQLYALPQANVLPGNGRFRTVVRSDRAAIFRLYCRSVPESVRRQEALTQQEYRAIHAAHETAHEYALDHEASMAVWVGIGEREARIMAGAVGGETLDACLDLIEAQPSRPATLVVPEFQPEVASRALERGYGELGARRVSARRMAILNPMKEVVVAGISETMPLPH